MWNSHGRSIITRTGPEAAAALTTRYHDQTGSNNDLDEELMYPISASEVAEASNMIFHRSPATPSDYVFSPSATVPAGQTSSNVYPRLRPNQSLRSEVLAMGHRLAADPAVQTAIVNDIVRHGGRVPQGRRSINPSLQSPPRDERGLARLVDMLDSEEEAPMVSERSRRTRGGRALSGQLVSRDRRGFFDYDEQGPLQHVRLAPQVSNTRRGTYTATPGTDWQPWSDEETKDGTSELEVPMEYLPLSPYMLQSDLSGSRLGDNQLGCSCRKCHEGNDLSHVVVSEGNCWKDVLAEYECDICFEVLVGVHVLDNCGHHFCGSCMERWMDNASQGECPVCRAPVDKLVPVRKMDEMIAKAVDAAAPSSERTAWYERKKHWEVTTHQRQESAERARAASVAHAQSAQANAFRRPTAAQTWFRGSGGNRRGADRDDDDGERNGFRLTKVQAVLAVAVMLVMAVLKIRGLRR